MLNSHHYRYNFPGTIRRFPVRIAINWSFSIHLYNSDNSSVISESKMGVNERRHYRGILHGIAEWLGNSIGF